MQTDMIKLVSTYLQLLVVIILKNVRNPYFAGTEVCQESSKKKRLKMQKSKTSVNIFFSYQQQ
jgi:hypothetical protein